MRIPIAILALMLCLQADTLVTHYGSGINDTTKKHANAKLPTRVDFYKTDMSDKISPFVSVDKPSDFDYNKSLLGPFSKEGFCKEEPKGAKAMTKGIESRVEKDPNALDGVKPAKIRAIRLGEGDKDTAKEINKEIDKNADKDADKSPATKGIDEADTAKDIKTPKKKALDDTDEAINTAKTLASFQKNLKNLSKIKASEDDVSSFAPKLPPLDRSRPVRVALIGGMVYSKLWPSLASIFTKDTGVKTKLVAYGPRPIISKYMEEGKVDLLIMHSGDITTNLVARGYATNMRPFAFNDLVIIGPKSDPAKIRGLNSGIEAVARIAKAKVPFIDFAGIGPRELGHSLFKASGIKPMGEWYKQDTLEDGKALLKKVGEENAYIITGRMPVVLHRWDMPKNLAILVDKDPIMRRPYIILEVNAKRFKKANAAGARLLSNYLLSPKVQHYLAKFDGDVDDGVPLFYPVYPYLKRT